MAAEGVISRGILTGEEEPEDVVEDNYGIPVPIILPHVTHLSVIESLTAIPKDAFRHHPYIIELVCHNRVKRIERGAFYRCPSLERLILPGVESVEPLAFSNCEAVKYVECAKLEYVFHQAFANCKSLDYIDLPSAKIVQSNAFYFCEVLKYVKFGRHLESLGEWVFCQCSSLERITIPLKNGLIEHDEDVFAGCHNLNRVDLVEDAILLDTVAALLMEEWRQDMSNVIGSINHILPNTPAGDDSGKGWAIQEWIGTVLRKIKDYKAQHRCLLNEAATILQLNLPNDIVHKNVLAFYELPLYAFDGEDDAAIEASTQRHTPPSKRLKSTQS